MSNSFMAIAQARLTSEDFLERSLQTLVVNANRTCQRLL